MDRNVETVANDEQKRIRKRLSELTRESPVEDNELSKNLTLYMPWQEVQRLLFFHELYQNIIEVPGAIMELGVRWGRNLTLLANLRASLEPHNHNRKIIGFDTFTGLPTPHEKDGGSKYAAAGALSVTEGHRDYLEMLLGLHEGAAPYAKMKKYEIIEGDATKSLADYLTRNPHTIISFVYFDMDIYEPTKQCLELIQPYLTKGSLVAFDEVNHETFPGETIAISEVFGLPNIRMRRSTLNPLCGYFIVE